MSTITTVVYKCDSCNKQFNDYELKPLVITGYTGNYGFHIEADLCRECNIKLVGPISNTLYKCTSIKTKGTK